MNALIMKKKVVFLLMADDCMLANHEGAKPSQKTQHN
jgi:hypothetical protein